ncbi:hypothetical protein E0H75_18230 [Kribbella capetownensis]|uniref:MFS transporter n=1 Tax=Kribbella capetownensis TaxID=1572659 RepID=A0A4R0JUI2_9ACTN|nr:hypothetical protein E0H75_18230 [Kribbella capetownensis]
MQQQATSHSRIVATPRATGNGSQLPTSRSGRALPWGVRDREPAASLMAVVVTCSIEIVGHPWSKRRDGCMNAETVTTHERAPGPRRGPVGGLLRTRNFGLFWVGESASGFGSAITTVALPLVAMTTLHAGTSMVALLTAANWVPFLVIGLPAGAWVDRWPRRRVLLAADLVSAVVLAGVPIAACSRRGSCGASATRAPIWQRISRSRRSSCSFRRPVPVGGCRCSRPDPSWC